MTKRTEIWSQMHKSLIKTHIEAPKIKKKLGGDPLNPPVERGINPPSRVFGTRCNLIARWAQKALLKGLPQCSYEMYFQLPFHLTIQLFKAG